MTIENRDLKELESKAGAYLKSIGRKGHLYRPRADNAVFVAVDMQNFVCRAEPGRSLPGIEAVMERGKRHGRFLP